MSHQQSEENQRAVRRVKIIATADWVLAQAYRACTKGEMIESQIRVRESVVREMRRRVRG